MWYVIGTICCDVMWYNTIWRGKNSCTYVRACVLMTWLTKLQTWQIMWCDVMMWCDLSRRDVMFMCSSSYYSTFLSSTDLIWFQILFTIPLHTPILTFFPSLSTFFYTFLSTLLSTSFIFDDQSNSSNLRSQVSAWSWSCSWSCSWRCSYTAVDMPIL